MLKVHAEEIKEPLFLIIQSSLESGTVPEEWKRGNISAIFKKGDRTDPGNYRPVSLTSIICKIQEKIIREHLLNHMQINNLISNKQYGFLPGRSTTLQLLKVLDEWTEILDKGDQIDAVYMDFMKAFDKVPHNRLMQKIHDYKFNDKVIRWIESFLTNRTQKVKINGSSSESHPVTSGIPQGSVLGPILFVIYINDMPLEVKNQIYLFADDTKIYTRVKSSSDQTNLQKDLDSLQSWSDTWLLKFHPHKCKAVSISKTDPIVETYHLYDNDGQRVVLDRSRGEKDIGVIVDDKLNFREHMNAQINKANSIMGLIRRTYTYLDEDSFKCLFKALVRPHLEYAEAVWNPYKKQDIEEIENVQRRATRQLPSLKGLSYPERLQKLNMPTLKYRRSRGT